MLTGGRAPRQKGDRLEREVVKLLQGAGISAKRVPLSGAAAGYPGDVVATFPCLGEVVLECKARSVSPLYGWLDNRDGLIIKADRRDPLLVMRLSDFLKLTNERRTLK